MKVDEAIQIAKEECKNRYALSYLNAIPEAIEYRDGEAVQALRVQLFYALNNMKSWRGEKAKEVKKVLYKFAQNT